MTSIIGTRKSDHTNSFITIYLEIRLCQPGSETGRGSLARNAAMGQSSVMRGCRVQVQGTYGTYETHGMGAGAQCSMLPSDLSIPLSHCLLPMRPMRPIRPSTSPPVPQKTPVLHDWDAGYWDAD